MKNKAEYGFVAGALATVLALAILIGITTVMASAKTTDRQGVTFEQMAAQKPLEGIVERDGHYYIYRRGRMLTGKVKYKGHWYYCHKTNSNQQQRLSVWFHDPRDDADRKRQ